STFIYNSIIMSEVCATQFIDGYKDFDEIIDTNGATPTIENGSQNPVNGNGLPTWGRLLSVNDDFPSIELQKHSVSVGRGSSCDFCLPSLKRSQQISTHHFTLLRMPDVKVDSQRNDSLGQSVNNGESKINTNGNGDCADEQANGHAEPTVTMVTILQDHSTNGTFVDGVKIGKDKQVLLQSNQVISLLSPSNRCWMYTACGSSESDQKPKLPASLADKYVLSKQLGEGGFGAVYLAYEIGTCEPCAIKILSKRDLFYLGNVSEVDRAIQTQEVKNLMTIQHPNIIRVMEFINETEEAFIVLEYMAGGDLYDKISECKTLSEAQAKHIGYQLADAILHLHENNITHRDIKPENVLLVDKNADMPTVKLTDFGLSKLLHRGTVLRTVCGTPGYTAPEIDLLEDEQSYTNKCDVWSLGALLFTCLFGRSYDRDADAELLALRAAASTELPDSPSDEASPSIAVSPSVASLLLAMLEPLPERRLGMADVVAHDWFADCRLGKADSSTAAAATASTGDSVEVNGGDTPQSQSDVNCQKPSLSSAPTLAAAAAHSASPAVSARSKKRQSKRLSAAAAAASPQPQSPARSSRRKRGRQEVDNSATEEVQLQQPQRDENRGEPEAAAAPLEPEAPQAKRWRGWGCQLL
ncbi:hypothetical protein BOX15_Mlig001032g1, partial [Macrostomum lignano]